MTPQSNFMVLAPIDPSARGGTAQLARLDERGARARWTQTTPLVPFAQFDTLHFARFVILDDKTVGDLRVYGLPPRTYPLYLAFLGDIDGEADAFLSEAGETRARRLARDFFMLPGIRVRHRSYGLDEAARQSRQRCLRELARPNSAPDSRRSAHCTMRSRAIMRARRLRLTVCRHAEIHAKLQRFVEAEKSAGRLTSVRRGGRRRLAGGSENLLHLIGMPLLVLLASPLLILIAPFYLFALRRLEKTDPELCIVVDDDHSRPWRSSEDHDVTNQFSAHGQLKARPLAARDAQRSCFW